MASYPRGHEAGVIGLMKQVSASWAPCMWIHCNGYLPSHQLTFGDFQV
jgi:hypothetical protein